MNCTNKKVFKLFKIYEFKIVIKEQLFFRDFLLLGKGWDSSIIEFTKFYSRNLVLKDDNSNQFSINRNVTLFYQNQQTSLDY